MQYIYIFDYVRGYCDITQMDSFLNVEEWLVSKGYNIDGISYMVTNTLNLTINT